MPRLQRLFVVLDKKAKALVGPIHREYSEVPIVRGVKEAVNNRDTLLAQNPADFDILHIGNIDEETGEIHLLEDTPFDSRIGEVGVIANALALREPQQ